MLTYCQYYIYFRVRVAFVTERFQTIPRRQLVITKCMDINNLITESREVAKSQTCMSSTSAVKCGKLHSEGKVQILSLDCSYV